MGDRLAAVDSDQDVESIHYDLASIRTLSSGAGPLPAGRGINVTVYNTSINGTLPVKRRENLQRVHFAHWVTIADNLRAISISRSSAAC
jgi:hypothetical protein